MRIIWQDLRYGARTLLKKPGFTLIAALTLSLGIGANTAIFSVINAVLLRPAPFADPGRLVTVAETHPEIPRLQVATPDFKDWGEQAHSFTDMAAYSLKTLGQPVLTDAGEPEQLQSACITPNLFPMLGLNPAMGRNFLPEENQTGRDRVALVSDALWRNRFASNPNFVGSSIRLDGESYTVVGVMPRGAQFPFDTDVWLPLSQLGTDLITNRVRHPLEVVARLKTGVAIDEARAEMNAVAGRLQQAYPATNKTIGVAVEPLREQLTGDLRPALLALFGTVALVLLITCANVSNLLLARAAGRQREVALRAALGAGRGRLFRQFLTESLLLASFGGAGGLLLAVFGMPALRAAASDFGAEQLPALQNVGLDLSVLGFTLLITLLTGLLFGMIPGFQLSRLDLNQTLKEGGKTSAGAGSRRASRALVVAEVALTMIALIGAGLLLRSFQRLMDVDPGFRADHLLSAQLTLPAAKYQKYQQLQDFHQRLLSRVASLPGVEGVATIDRFPLAASNAKTRFAIEGAPPPAPGHFPVAQLRNVSQGYFKVMGIALKGGREFTEDDLVNNRNYLIINETFARRYFPNEDPVGKKILMGVMFPNPVSAPVVGVVADVKDLGLMSPAEPAIYGPAYTNQPMLMVRTSGDPTALGPALRQAVLATDGEQPTRRIRSMGDTLSATLARRRLSALLTGAFAAMALLLSAIGIYGVLSWTITERTKELGIRLALGAQPRDALRLVIGHGMKLTAVGLASGLLGSLLAGKAMQGMLFGVGAYDPATFVVITGILALTALLACYLPARRATKVDPIVALRHE
jgi:putative ABC transport system permease protein